MSVVILHDRINSENKDGYLLKMGLTYQSRGHDVTIYTPSVEKRLVTEGSELLDSLEVIQLLPRTPSSFLGLFRDFIATLKVIFMALYIAIIHTSAERVTFISDQIPAFFIMNNFSRFKMIYVATFNKMVMDPDFCQHALYNPSLFEVKCMRAPHIVVCESFIHSQIFKYSFPRVITPEIIYAPVDGIFADPDLDVDRVLPYISMGNNKMLLALGRYISPFSFQIVIDAFEKLINYPPLSQLHLVMAGRCETLEEQANFADLATYVSKKPFATQVDFIVHLEEAHETALIDKASLVIFPSKGYLKPDYLLKAMFLGKPILTANSGLYSSIIDNQMFGLGFHSKAYSLYKDMDKLMMNKKLRFFMGQVGSDVYKQQYAFKVFCNRLCNLTKLE